MTQTKHKLGVDSFTFFILVSSNYFILRLPDVSQLLLSGELFPLLCWCTVILLTGKWLLLWLL